MIAVIFEFTPYPEGRDRYFELARALRDEVDNAEGFISIERFESTTNPGKFVSLSFWEDEAAVEKWYNNAAHKAAQNEGNAKLFKEYRLRVGKIFRDYTKETGRPET